MKGSIILYTLFALLLLSGLSGVLASETEEGVFMEVRYLPRISDLPNPFLFQDGSEVKTLADWEKRQEEIAGLYQYYMYGAYPDSSGEKITTEYVDSYELTTFWGDVISLSETATFKLLKINVSKAEKRASFISFITFPGQENEKGEMVIAPPQHEGGYPVLIVIGFLGPDQKEYLNKHGYAVIEFNNNDVAADNSSRTGAFYELYPYGKDWQEQTGVLMAWAWGVSKIIDVIEADAVGSNELQISPVNTIVTGVSRNGKAAAVAGAFDKRIRVTVPASSGLGGITSFRYESKGRKYNYSMLRKEEFIDFQGEGEGTSSWQNYQVHPYHIVGNNETLGVLQSSAEAHWFNDKFKEFTSPLQLPFDQHLLVALAAEPGRYYLITGEIVGGDWVNTPGMYVTYLAAQRIYDVLGISDNIGIHLHAVGHALTLENTKYLVEFCEKHLYGKTHGVKDLRDLKASIYENEENYDPYFDTIKNMPVPELKYYND